MPRAESEVRITPTLLDRLIDDEPEVTREAPVSRLKSLRQLKNAVKRDLEWLLNSRSVIDDIPEDLKELKQSVFVFGIPDFTSANVTSLSDQTRIRKIVMAAIDAFEPNLKDIAVVRTFPAFPHLREPSGRTRPRTRYLRHHAPSVERGVYRSG
jgi:type VI secretion system protein ImpF